MAKPKNKREEILKRYSNLAKKLKKYPTYVELKKVDIPRHTIQHYFGNMDELKVEAKELYPDSFNSVIDYEVWNDQRLKEIKEVIKKGDRFVVTTAVGNSPVHKKFLSSIDSYCKKTGSELLILVAENDLGNIDGELVHRNIIFDDLKLNSNLFISTIKLSPKQIDPSTGLHRIAKDHGSFIFASPKQRLKYEPVSGENPLPRCLMTTGAITLPRYQGKRYIQKRTDYLANSDHKIGAIIVELENNKFFHFRQIQADNNGGFHDLGNYYDGDKIIESPAEAFVYGDWHSGETDPIAKQCWEDVAKDTKCKTVIIHDGFNGLSINHHEDGDHTTKATRAMETSLSLENEIRTFAQDMQYLTGIYEKVIIVKSNHDLFLDRYLREGKYVRDHQNHYYSLDLAKKLIEGRDVLKWATEQFLEDKQKEKIVWLKEDEKHEVEGILISNHGHRGPNGSRGSIASLEKVAYKSVVGHTHTPQILREIWQVGTSTKLRLSYNVGPSSWFQTSCLIYKGGARQMINCVNGRFTTNK